MLKARSRWQLSSFDDSVSKEIAEACDISLLLARLLVLRGMNTPELVKAFLHASPEQFHHPFLMDGMEKSVHRIRQAIANKEAICIYGDYDADGVSSTSLMVHLMRKLGATFDYYIPNRFKEGYGLNKDALSYLHDSGFQLVVTVDTGISAVDQVEHSKQLGLDLIITDHHEPPAIIPDAYAVINPKKPGCSYPFDMLAGVGVAFKLGHALLEEPPMDLIDLAAIGTIADLVPLIDENRVLASLGLKRLNQTRNIGIKALIDVCGLGDKELTAGHVGFAIGPRINAVGRLETAEAAVQLLVTDDKEEAKDLAETLDQINKERQDLVSEMADEAIAMVEEMYPPDSNHVLVVAKEGWNVGVVGIVASRLVEKFYRPTIVLGIDSEKGIAKGSARSIAGFDMYEALTASKELLPHYGGHTMAAGMTLPIENLEPFREQLNQLAGTLLSPEDYIPQSRVDLEVTIEDMSLDLASELEEMAPFGMGNPTPILLCKEASHQGMRKIGKDESHLKCMLSHNQKQIDAIGFQFASIMEKVTPNARLSLLGELQVNEWNGNKKPQFMLKDIAVMHQQIFDWRGIRDKERKWLEQHRHQPSITVTFQKQSYDTLCQICKDSGLDDTRISYITEIGIMEGKKPGGEPRLLIYDLPTSPKALQHALTAFSELEVVTCMFGESDHSFELLHVPSREDFKVLYQIFRQYDKINKAHLDSLAKKMKVKRSVLERMLAVFLDLQFISEEEKTYSYYPEPKKSSLESSELLVTWKREAEMHAELLLSNHEGLAKYLEAIHHLPE
ncbi:single-stranded-DNA-specific exonuclease RecJ [Brevibacillus daliensis]|uniref:single-stranded-DNA-specific exonuclease RecJ n=1 Tax=Brevibacillus daliensis TaxID=2892995 RepID=UPI001E5ED467|nr:single-stranded-DNA-specific exonuclease RecJ [Brevibacillus daliensis]